MKNFLRRVFKRPTHVVFVYFEPVIQEGWDGVASITAYAPIVWFVRDTKAMFKHLPLYGDFGDSKIVAGWEIYPL